MASSLCRFGIFYIDKENEIYEYFILEKIKEYNKYKYVVCGKKDMKIIKIIFMDVIRDF